MKINDIITSELVTHLTSTTKNESILELLNLICSKRSAPDIQLLAEKIFHRESLMSTGIGLGLGIPHTRIKGISNPIIAVGVQPASISDYETIDKIPIKILIMIICGEKQHNLHIKLLSQLVSKFKKNEIVDRIVNAGNNLEVYKIIKES